MNNKNFFINQFIHNLNNNGNPKYTREDLEALWNKLFSSTSPAKVRTLQNSLVNATKKRYPGMRTPNAKILAKWNTRPQNVTNIIKRYRRRVKTARKRQRA